jgi:LytS/YehU family sensor histidine kinase
MAIITVVGFAELPGFDKVAGAHAFILGGIAAAAYFQSTFTALLIEGTIGGELERRKKSCWVTAPK